MQSLQTECLITPEMSQAEAGKQSMTGSARVLILSTTGFTVMFAAWLVFAVLAVPIKEEFKLTASQFGWLVSIPVLNGSIWRLPFGLLTDRYGGRLLTLMLLIAGAVASYLLSTAKSFEQLLIYGFMLGILGNSFSVAIAWTSAWFPKDRQGVALGTVGVGNIGSSINKLAGPLLLSAIPASGLLGGFVPGGWRAIPFLYSILLSIMAVVLWLVAPATDRRPGHGRPMREMLLPLKEVRLWCFGLYYVVVFGAYVALCIWLPSYYMRVYETSFFNGAALASLFVFPASLLRPLGGWLSDRYGASKVTYSVFAAMLLSCLPLALPPGALGFKIDVAVFTALIFVLGICMGVGKAAVYKYISHYFEKDVGAAGGLVGTLGALGGFFLPLIWGYVEAWSGRPYSIFFVLLLLIASSFVWLHLVVIGKDRLISDHFLPVGFGAAFFLMLWSLASLLSREMPGPWTTAMLCVEFIQQSFWGAQNRVGLPMLVLYSVLRVLAGFFLGALIAIPLGFLVGCKPFMRRALHPLIELARPISPLAWYPVALAIFSAPAMQNERFKAPTMAAIFVIFVCSLWPTLLNTSFGVMQINKDYLNVARMLKMSEWQIFRDIYWPATLPHIVTGLRISLGIAWMVIVAAEMLNGQDGIGFFCWDQYNAGSVDRSILAMLLIGIVGLLMNVVMTRLEKAVSH
ncbi:MAG TPA: MFS transporter [Planctomycetota bacterium]|nr:MFS transporter [Planctomycetota bacterium]